MKMTNSTYYSEVQFSIDLIRDAYKTNDINLIKRKLESDLHMNVSKSQIKDVLNYTEDYEKESRTVKMKQIFN